MRRVQTMKGIIWLAALIGVLWFGVVKLPSQQENASNSVLLSHSYIEGTALAPISPVLYPDYHIYGTLVADIVECESGGKHEGVWGKAKEYGIAQFKEKTFYWLAELSGLENPDWYDEEQQLWLLNWAVENGYEKHWTCAKVADN